MRINLGNVYRSDLFKKDKGSYYTLLENLVGKGGEDGYGDFDDLVKPLYDDVTLKGFGIVDVNTGKVVWYIYDHESDAHGQTISITYQSISSEEQPEKLSCTIYYGRSFMSGDL